MEKETTPPLFTTPMMKQYQEIKKTYADALLFFRMGDFYELFLEDAKVGARILNITLTGKSAGKNNRIPMAGVPYHAVDVYLAKLVHAGYKVAICEQVSEPNKYGIVDRKVIRVVTPGTILDEKALEKKQNNYVMSIALHDDQIGIAVADVSTGEFQADEFITQKPDEIITTQLTRWKAAECILSETAYNNRHLLRTLSLQKGMNISLFPDWETFAQSAEVFLKKQFAIKTLKSFDLDKKIAAQQAGAALLGYLMYTQQGKVSHIQKICSFENQEHMLLDRSTIINLELFATLREQTENGTLLSILDDTISAMGGRRIRNWIAKPLVSEKEITERLAAVEEFVRKRTKRAILREHLREVADIERIISRLTLHNGNARDLVNLKLSLQAALRLKDELSDFSEELTKRVQKSISHKLKVSIQIIDTIIVPEPPIEITQGGLIQPGVNERLDTLKYTISKSRKWVDNLEKEERVRTKINSLKVRFNKVFGFYIEVSTPNLSAVPKDYIRKQTLVNGERFITPELKKHEEIILKAEEKINRLEYEIFHETLEKILSHTDILQKSAEALATLDTLLSFAQVAEKNQYTKPKIVYSGEIKIKGGRHPVVEKTLENRRFVPNDVLLNHTNHQLLMITGPNMAGKSVYIRQVALIVLLAQIGSFVPADQAYLTLVDRIFVRSGAHDVITQGLSTFMVEMVETASILHHATHKSLIIMDEIGRGTSTYDGISLAWAIAEYCLEFGKKNPKTLFATHYHELQTLAEKYPTNVKNYQVAIEEQKGEPIFLHTVIPGGASHSFGVAVAKMAGIPEVIIKRAFEILEDLEKRDSKVSAHKAQIQESTNSKSEVQNFLEKTDINNITPLEALNILHSLKKKLIDANG